MGTEIITSIVWNSEGNAQSSWTCQKQQQQIKQKYKIYRDRVSYSWQSYVYVELLLLKVG